MSVLKLCLVHAEAMFSSCRSYVYFERGMFISNVVCNLISWLRPKEEKLGSKSVEAKGQERWSSSWEKLGLGSKVEWASSFSHYTQII